MTNLPIASQAAAYEEFWPAKNGEYSPHMWWVFRQMKRNLGGRDRNTGGSWLALAHHMLQAWPTPLEPSKFEGLVWCVQNGVPAVEHTALMPEFAGLFSSEEKACAARRIADAEQELAGRQAERSA